MVFIELILFCKTHWGDAKCVLDLLFSDKIFKNILWDLAEIDIDCASWALEDSKKSGNLSIHVGNAIDDLRKAILKFEKPLKKTQLLGLIKPSCQARSHGYGVITELFLLKALCHHQLGETELANECLLKAYSNFVLYAKAEIEIAEEDECYKDTANLEKRAALELIRGDDYYSNQVEKTKNEINEKRKYLEDLIKKANAGDL